MLIGQFGYGACQHNGPFDSGKGWKVTEVMSVPGSRLTDELTQLAARRAGEFSAPRLPDYPSRDELLAMPSSLRLDSVADSVACLLKSATAGDDFTRRSSIFSHGLLVDGPLQDAAGTVRPAELWDWQWLQPIGADEVESARLDQQLSVVARDRLTPTSLLPFAFGRPELLRPLLAALAASIERAVPLILVEDDPAVAACWFAVLQYFLPPTVAWRLPFNTYRKAGELVQAPVSGAAMIAVPSDDPVGLQRLRGGPALLIPTSQPPVEERDESGDPCWRGVSDQPLVASRWAQLAYRTMELDPWTLPTVFQTLDELAGSLSEGCLTSPFWALPAAMLLATVPLTSSELDGCAGLLIGSWPPAETLPEQAAQQLRQRATAALSEPYRVFAGKARQMCSQGSGSSAFQDVVVGGYLAESLSDRPAASADGHWWAPPAGALSEPAERKLLESVPHLLAWTVERPAGDIEAARVTTIAAEIIQAAQVSEQRSRARTAMEAVMYRHLLPVLGGAATDAELAQLVATAPAGFAEVLWNNGVQRFLRCLCAPVDSPLPEEFLELGSLIVDRRARPVGQRIDAPVHEWLAGWLDPSLEAVPGSGRPDGLVFEQAAYRVGVPREGVALGGAATWGYLARLTSPPAEVDVQEWPTLAAQQVWGRDLTGMLEVAPAVLEKMPSDSQVPSLLEALLLACPLGQAGPVLRSWQGPVTGEVAILHRKFRHDQLFDDLLSYASATLQTEQIADCLAGLAVSGPLPDTPFVRSSRIRVAALFLRIELSSAIRDARMFQMTQFWQGKLDAQLELADFAAAWQQLTRAPDRQLPFDRELILAMLYVRSLVSFDRDPARVWLTEPIDDRRPEPAMASRLRPVLAELRPGNQRDFLSKVDDLGQGIANSALAESVLERAGFKGTKDFLRACTSSAARLLGDGGGGAGRLSLPFGSSR